MQMLPGPRKKLLCAEHAKIAKRGLTKCESMCCESPSAGSKSSPRKVQNEFNGLPLTKKLMLIALYERLAHCPQQSGEKVMWMAWT